MTKAKIRNVSFGTYTRIDAINASLLKSVTTDSPLVAQYNLANPRESAAFDFGRAWHLKILEPENYYRSVVVWEHQRKGKEWKLFSELNANKLILYPADHQAIEKMAQRLFADNIAAEYLKKRGRSEVTIEWTHERTGAKCKCRLDKANTGGPILELKSALHVDGRFLRDCIRYRYDIQFSFYRDGAMAAELGNGEVKVIAQAKTPPYDVVVYDVPETQLIAGRVAYEQAMDQILECKRTGRWSGWANGEEKTLMLPDYLYDQDDEALEGVA